VSNEGAFRRQPKRPCASADPPASAGSYLGAQQLAWLRRQLARSRATWKVVGSTTVMLGTDLNPGEPINLGQWDGYPEERRALMEGILADGVRGVVVLSGDLHTMIAGQVTTTGRADGKAAAVDFTSGAITSNGLIEMFRLDPSIAPGLEAQGRMVNPHIAFLDLLAKGYGIVEADARELRVTYRSGPLPRAARRACRRDSLTGRIIYPSIAAERRSASGTFCPTAVRSSPQSEYFVGESAFGSVSLAGLRWTQSPNKEGPRR
jgi:phosphodiesterase/alkaline phosphatase D-like protein